MNATKKLTRLLKKKTEFDIFSPLFAINTDHKGWIFLLYNASSSSYVKLFDGSFFSWRFSSIFSYMQIQIYLIYHTTTLKDNYRSYYVKQLVLHCRYANNTCLKDLIRILAKTDFFKALNPLVCTTGYIRAE